MNFISSVPCIHLIFRFFQLNVVIGPNVPGSCIQSRMKALRKKANDMGVAPEASSSNSTTKRSRGTAPTTPVKKAKLNKTEKVFDDDDSDEDGNGHLVTPSSSDDLTEGMTKPMTPPPSAEIIKAKKTVKSRVSPRKAAKKDYKTLGDPFVALDNAENSSGEVIFGTDKSESEDSAASDGEFGAEATKTPEPEVKAEETVEI